jgi:hypothetical protein
MSTQKSERLDSSKVLEWAQRRKRFSTAQVAKTFAVRPNQASAAIAILRIKQVVERDESAGKQSNDKSSRWVFTG